MVQSSYNICVFIKHKCITYNNWMALWKIWISSTTMKLRKSLVKPVMRQNIPGIELFGSSTRDRRARHINVILWTSADICVVVHDDLGWKNRTVRYNCRFSAASLALRVVFVRRKRPPIYASCMMISGGRTEQQVVIGLWPHCNRRTINSFMMMMMMTSTTWLNIFRCRGISTVTWV